MNTATHAVMPMDSNRPYLAGSEAECRAYMERFYVDGAYAELCPLVRKNGKVFVDRPSKRAEREANLTTPADSARIDAMFDANADKLQQLWARWQDEKQYEDIEEYRAVMQKRMPEGFVITQFMKAPFGFKFTIGTAAVYQMNAGGRKITWKRVK